MDGYEGKKWYESKTIWGGIVTIAAIAAGVFGYTITPETQQELVTNLTAAAATVGALISIYGRVTASKRIDG